MKQKSNLELVSNYLKKCKVGFYAELDGRTAERSHMAGGEYLMYDNAGFIRQTNSAEEAAKFVLAVPV